MKFPPAVLFLLILLPMSASALEDRLPVGKEKQIVDRYWEILVRSPRRGTTFERLYGSYVDSGHSDLLLEKSRELFRSASDDVEKAKSHLITGLLFERRGEIRQAAECFEEASRFDPANALSSYYLAEQYIALERFPEAVDALEESLRRKPAKTDVRVILQTLGRTAERMGDARKSDEVWKRLEELYAEDPEILAQIAETLESEGRYDEALKRYRRLLSRDSDDPYARVRWTLAVADIESAQGWDESAIAEFERLLDRLAPESWLAESVRLRVERLFTGKGDDEGLAEFYRKRLEKHPHEAESVRSAAAVLSRLGRNDEALRLVETTVEKIPSNIPLRLTLVDLLVGQEKIAPALEQFRQIDRLAPNNVDYITRWGKLVLRNPDGDESARKAGAVEIWSRLAEAAPEDPLAAIHVADLATQYDIPVAAEKYYRKALELRPDNPAYREYLGLFYHREHRKDDAVRMLRSIAEDSRKNVENLVQAGTLLQSLGYVDPAREMFQNAVREAPGDVQVAWKYAEILIQGDEIEQAADQILRMDGLIEKDEQFDSFLQREIRFLQSVGKLDRMSEHFDSRFPLDRSDGSDALETATAKRRMLWRRAVYKQAQGRLRDAEKIMEIALNLSAKDEEPSGRMLQSAAEIFEQSGNAEKALEIYRNLSEIDGVWRIEHLKHLATLQLRLERFDEALETGRRIMGLGSGNAANIRFHAELLLKMDRRAEAVDVLRQALRVEPGDVSILKMLAENLAATGKVSEALEIAWRLFERTESVYGKLDRIPMLVDYYRQADQFPVLLRRLRFGLGNESGTNSAESDLCLARALAVVEDWKSARSVLENRLSILEETELDDGLLLRQLVEAVEKLEDLPAAVRYQEMLCKRSQNSVDWDRLFVLYDENGDRKKAVDLFLGRVLLKGDLEARLESIDRMIGREEYDAVDRVLSFMEIHDSEHWKIAYRRIALDAFAEPEYLEDSVLDFQESTYPDDSPVRQKESASNAEENVSEPWLISGVGSSKNADEAEEFKRIDLFLPTLFRDRLVRNDDYRTPNDVPPLKPFFKPESFREARFLTLGWLLRERLEKSGEQEFQNTVDQLKSNYSPEPVPFEYFVRRIREIGVLK